MFTTPVRIISLSPARSFCIPLNFIETLQVAFVRVIWEEISRDRISLSRRCAYSYKPCFCDEPTDMCPGT